MTPNLTSSHLINEAFRDLVFNGENKGGLRASQDVAHSVISQFGVTASLAASKFFGMSTGMMLVTRRMTLRTATFTDQSGSDSMSRICARRRPFKVLYSVVGFDSVDVIDTSDTFRWFSNKSTSDQLVYESELQRLVTTAGQSNANVAAVGHPTLEVATSISSGSVNGSFDTTEIRHRVPPFPSNDWAPYFLHADSLLHVSQN